MANGSGVGMAMRRRVMREDGYRCVMCGLVGFESRVHHPGARNACITFPTALEGVYLSIDHVIPKARGGTHERSNLRILCTTCNTRKGVKPAVPGNHLVGLLSELG